MFAAREAVGCDPSFCWRLPDVRAPEAAGCKQNPSQSLALALVIMRHLQTVTTEVVPTPPRLPAPQLDQTTKQPPKHPLRPDHAPSPPACSSEVKACAIPGGGGGMEGSEQAQNLNGEMWCREILAPILPYHCNIWYKFADCGTRTSIDSEWWLFFPMGLWLVAAISYSL